MATNASYRAIFDNASCWDLPEEVATNGPGDDSDGDSECWSDSEEMDPINAHDLFESMFAHPLFVGTFFTTESTCDCFSDAANGQAIAHCHEPLLYAEETSGDGTIYPPSDTWYAMVRAIVSCSYYSPYSAEYRALPAALRDRLQRFLDEAETLLPGFTSQGLPPANFDSKAIPPPGWWASRNWRRDGVLLGRVPFLNPLFDHLCSGTLDSNDVRLAVTDHAVVDAPAVVTYLSLWSPQTISWCVSLLDDPTTAILLAADENGAIAAATSSL